MHRHWCPPLTPVLPRPRPAGWNSEQPPENRSKLFQTFHPTAANQHRAPRMEQ